MFSIQKCQKVPSFHKKLESGNSHTKPPRFFQFPESQTHLQSIIQGKLGLLGFVRTLRNLNISSCDPEFLKCWQSKISMCFLHFCYTTAQKNESTLPDDFPAMRWTGAKYEEQEKHKANKNETNLNLKYQTSINILLVVLLAAPSGRTRVQYPAPP